MNDTKDTGVSVLTDIVAATFWMAAISGYALVQDNWQAITGITNAKIFDTFEAPKQAAILKTLPIVEQTDPLPLPHNNDVTYGRIACKGYVVDGGLVSESLKGKWLDLVNPKDPGAELYTGLYGGKLAPVGVVCPKKTEYDWAYYERLRAQDSLVRIGNR